MDETGERERECFFFFNLIIANDRYNEALYIRFYCSILMFMESYRKYVGGPFL